MCVFVCVSVGVITVITTVLPYSEKPNIGAASSFGDLQSRGSPKKTLLIRGWAMLSHPYLKKKIVIGDHHPS